MTQTEAFSPDAPAPVLQARGAGFGYAPGKAVFEDISLSIAPREIVCLLGGSGCGKSSLLRVLGGLESPDGGAWSRGELQFLGQPLTAPHPRAGFVFQQPSLLPWLDARRNVGFGLDFERQPKLEAEARRLPATVQRIPTQGSTTVADDGSVREEAHADALKITARPQAPIQVVLTGHYDTVFPADSRFQTVTTRADGALNGPGVADMKGGISVLLAALEAFETHPERHGVGWTVLLSPCLLYTSPSPRDS